MINPIKIAVDAMGGENSPNKVIKGIDIHYSKSKEVFYNIFGDENIIIPLIKKTKLTNKNFKIINTKNSIKDTDSPLSAAKKGKDTSMWLSLESLKNNDSDAMVSAGNTGALFVIAKLNLNMIEKIDKPALSALWPNKIGMNIVLDRALENSSLFISGSRRCSSSCSVSSVIVSLVSLVSLVSRD